MPTDKKKTSLFVERTDVQETDVFIGLRTTEVDPAKRNSKWSYEVLVEDILARLPEIAGGIALPSQTGQGGKVLKTDGTNLLWATDEQGTTGTTQGPAAPTWTAGPKPAGTLVYWLGKVYRVKDPGLATSTAAPGTFNNWSSFWELVGYDDTALSAQLQALTVRVTNLEGVVAGKEPAFTKNTAFNKNFGTTAGTVAEGNHLHDSRYIRTVNSVGPDANGNVLVQAGTGGGGVAGVGSVNGRSGAVTLTKNDVQLNDVDNTSDANKPISIATQQALNTKVSEGDPRLTDARPPAAHLHPISQVTGLQAALDSKVAQEAGKGLSTNDFTTLLLNKLNSLQNFSFPDQTGQGGKVLHTNGTTTYWGVKEAGTGGGSLTGATTVRVELTSAKQVLPIAPNAQGQYAVGVMAVASLVEGDSNRNVPLDPVTDYEVRNPGTAQAALAILNPQVGDEAADRLSYVPIFPASNTPGGSYSDEQARAANAPRFDLVENRVTTLEGRPTGGVTSFNNRTGPVTATKADVGLSNADNTSDLNKPISTAAQQALNGKISEGDSRLNDARTPTTHIHPATQITGLAAVATTGSYADLINIPASATPYTDDQARQANDARFDVVEASVTTREPSIGPKGTAFNKNLGLGATDVAPGNHLHDGRYIRTVNSVGPDANGNIVVATNTGGSGVAGVSTVNGRDGAVTLTKNDVGLGDVNNTSDINKPLSTATQNALAGKISEGDYRLSDARNPTTHTHPATQITGLAAVATSGSYNDLTNKPASATPYTDDQARAANDARFDNVEGRVGASEININTLATGLNAAYREIETKRSKNAALVSLQPDGALLEYDSLLAAINGSGNPEGKRLNLPLTGAATLSGRTLRLNGAAVDLRALLTVQNSNIINGTLTGGTPPRFQGPNNALVDSVFTLPLQLNEGTVILRGCIVGVTTGNWATGTGTIILGPGTYADTVGGLPGPIDVTAVDAGVTVYYQTPAGVSAKPASPITAAQLYAFLNKEQFTLQGDIISLSAGATPAQPAAPTNLTVDGNRNASFTPAAGTVATDYEYQTV